MLMGAGRPSAAEVMASRNAIAAGASAISDGKISSPSPVFSLSTLSLKVRMASRKAAFHSPSVPSLGYPFPASIVPSTPLLDRIKTDA